jgi:ribosomal protein L24E
MLKMSNCSICGKEFLPTYHWMYKRTIDKRVAYQCSYTCYRKAGGDGGIREPQDIGPDISLPKVRKKAKKYRITRKGNGYNLL